MRKSLRVFGAGVATAALMAVGSPAFAAPQGMDLDLNLDKLTAASKATGGAGGDGGSGGIGINALSCLSVVNLLGDTTQACSAGNGGDGGDGGNAKATAENSNEN
ncbi:hypothetical protein DFQ14_107219 [Halopolyspora algeriensis]|uniref:Small secreted domain DUF320 n=1 Tax=Halopolyspora algeriensis TaxID=1500506 RepID=A0A368VNN3_9ACTN|nr:hypothetical protein [Halopolyspora algeriensis]RCW43329.1 hypothetical protein DFQ14_107219 [Halopolyspora algeriensis]TQM56386.1 hypothetical protein FHU43_1182 [Halopolyspora algeriensis]